MKNKTTIELVNRINEIRQEQQNLDIEYNKIVKELWQRIPSLKEDVNMQPKKMVRCKDEKKRIP
jgi:hypothetical protein